MDIIRTPRSRRIAPSSLRPSKASVCRTKSSIPESPGFGPPRYSEAVVAGRDDVGAWMAYLAFGSPSELRLPLEGHEARDRACRIAWMSSSGASTGGGASSAVANAACSS